MLELQHIGFEVDTPEQHKEILKDINLTIDDRFVAITGPNGGGKSTLAKIIAGIITPTSGQILLDGEDITNLSITERAQKGISFAFQQPVRFKGLTVKDLITLASGEPEAGIDLWSFSNLIQVFEHLHEKINGSIIIISHQERILNIADQIIVLANGHLRQMGSKDEVLPALLAGSSPAVCSALSEKVR